MADVFFASGSECICGRKAELTIGNNSPNSLWANPMYTFVRFTSELSKLTRELLFIAPAVGQIPVSSESEKKNIFCALWRTAIKEISTSSEYCSNSMTSTRKFTKIIWRNTKCLLAASRQTGSRSMTSALQFSPRVCQVGRISRCRLT